MRRKYISPEFEYINVPGTLDMKEESTFFGSKMLEIEDSILIDSNNIIYYQKSTNEQLDLTSEINLPPVIFNLIDIKSANQTLTLDPTQPIYQKEDKTRWILRLNLKNILVNFVFAKIKEYRAFEGVTNVNTIYNNVDVAIKDYVSSNVLDRYTFRSMDLYLNYKSLNNQNVLKYQNTFSSDAENDANKLNKVEINLNYDQSLMEAKFSQEKSGSEYIFEYYFNLNFVKL